MKSREYRVGDGTIVFRECGLSSECAHYPTACECTHPWHRHYHRVISGPEGSAGYDG